MTSDQFKIHAICLVKDEIDVIGQSLGAALSWCDYIYVYDNGSTDGTWEFVQRLANKHQGIIPFKQDAKTFHNGMRSEVFNHFRKNASRGDWWCILDADEFYVDDPKLFLAKVPSAYGVVCSASLQYYFTDHDWELFQQSPDLYADDVPVEKKLRYYLNNWSELRFFRHYDHLSWSNERSSPRNLPPVCPVRICLKHYQYRSPQQMEKRLALRFGSPRPFVHEVQRNWQATVLDTTKTSHATILGGSEAPVWQDRIMPAATLYVDRKDGRYVVREDLMPRLPLHLRHTLKALIEEFARRVRKRLRIGDKI